MGKYFKFRLLKKIKQLSGQSIFIYLRKAVSCIFVYSVSAIDFLRLYMFYFFQKLLKLYARLNVLLSIIQNILFLKVLTTSLFLNKL